MSFVGSYVTFWNGVDHLVNSGIGLFQDCSKISIIRAHQISQFNTPDDKLRSIIIPWINKAGAWLRRQLYTEHSPLFVGRILGSLIWINFLEQKEIETLSGRSGVGFSKKIAVNVVLVVTFMKRQHRDLFRRSKKIRIFLFLVSFYNLFIFNDFQYHLRM